MVKPINVYTNPEQAKILRMKAEPVIGMPDHVKQLIEDLMDTCAAHPTCVGLSSNQIWTEQSPAPAVFVMKMRDGIFRCVNPEITKIWKKEIKDEEGCMSMPGVKRKVVRPRHIQVSYYDVEGRFYKDVDIFDMGARIFCHEYDHLQGKLIGDK